MAIPKFLEDLNIVSRLGDRPGSDDGLSTQGFKSKFDEAALKIQEYINEKLIPGIEGSVSEEGLLSQISEKLAEKLSISGGDMRGNISMNRNMVKNLGTPSEPRDATSKEYVDVALTDAVDDVKEYVDSRVQYFDVVVTADAWAGDSAPFKQTIAVEGMMAKYRPHYGLVYSEDIETAIAEKDAWTLVDDLDTADGSVTFTCFEEKPEISLNVQMEVNR